MASKPGILTEWPWTWLGNFKYVVLAPFVVHSTYSYLTKCPSERDPTVLMIFPFLLVRIIHNQLWISLSRYRTAKGDNRIVDKGIEFEQVDRERNWDDQIILNGILYYWGYYKLPITHHMPIWRTDGVIITALIHIGPVEFLYYWLHRALHHHFLYSRYHSHHHSSIVTEPITSVIHPFAEDIAYFAVYAIPLLTIALTGTSSIISFGFYILYIDFMNNMGHCNFEFIPSWLFSMFPPLKYMVYTPTYHSLHHTQVRTNYSLFMPIYDYLYNTMDISSDTLYEKSLKKKGDSPDVVHLTHLISPESIYHLRIGFASLASNPQSSNWYLWLMWPVTVWSMMITWIYGHTFVLERNVFKNLKLQTWAIPKYLFQTSLYFIYLTTKYNLVVLHAMAKGDYQQFIEEAILEAEDRGIKVLSLGLLNQEELNMNEEVFIGKNPQLKVKVVDGSSLAVAVVLNSIPKGTTQVVLRGNLSKVAYSIVLALCKRGTHVNLTIYDWLSRFFL